MMCDVTIRVGNTTLAFARLEAERTVDALQQVMQRPDIVQHLSDMRYGAIVAHVAPANNLRATVGVTDAPKPWEKAA